MWLREALGLPEPPEPKGTTVLHEALMESWDARREALKELRAWDAERQELIGTSDRVDVAQALRRARVARDGR